MSLKSVHVINFNHVALKGPPELKGAAEASVARMQISGK